MKNLLPILSTGQKLRQKWLEQYRSVEKKLFKLRREWNLFEQEAQAEYQLWYHQRFGSELGAVKTLEDECRELTLVLAAVEAQIRVNAMTKKNAYAYVILAMQEKRDPFPTEEEQIRERDERRREFQEQFKKTFAGRLDPSEEIDPLILERARATVAEWARSNFRMAPRSHSEAQQRERRVTEALHEVYEDLKKGYSDSESEANSHDSSFSDEPPSESDVIDQIKTLYRKIVRVLHPDRGREMNLSEKELWSQTQTAYQHHDYEALRSIFLRLEGTGESRVEDLDSIGAIMELTRALEDEFIEVSRQRNRVKKDPVYRFWVSRGRGKNRTILEDDIKIGLRRKVFELKGALKELKSEAAQFQRRTRN